MSEAEINTLCNELVGMFAYNAWINQPVKNPEEVERFLALSNEERAKWQHVELEITTEVLGAAPVAIIESIAKGIAHSNLKAQGDGKQECSCQACHWGRAVITSFMVVQARQAEQRKQDVENFKK